MRRHVENPRNPFHAQHYAWEDAPPPEVELEVTEIEARSILSKNDSPDVPFRFGLNPYQGCYHGCAYCYARPSHQYLGLGAGTDFERKLQVKVNAPELLREAFTRKSWQGDALVIAGNTDCYQPLEARYALTRRCLEVCLEFRNPVGIITKGSVALRDVELLGALAEVTSVHVFVTIPFLCARTARVLEPFAAPIEKRFELLRRLSETRVQTGISLAPIIPGLNEGDIPALLSRGRDAGARHAFMSLLRLPAEVKEVFFSRIEAGLHPARVKRIEGAIREVRGGALSDSRFGHRMRGSGERWAVVERLFEAQCRRLGLNQERLGEAAAADTFRRPRRQLSLFDER